jgi:exopolysaccharide production protein ExoZ
MQAGRAIAALLVVLHHVSTFTGGEPGLWNHPQIARWLAGPSLGVAFFFVLSGTVILTAHWNDIGKPTTVRPYIAKRFRRIYPIYWVVLIIILAGQLTHAEPQFSYQRNPYVILSNILLVHIHSTETNLIVAWTLFHEIAFYAVFATLLLHKRLGISLLSLWFAGSLITLHGNLPTHPATIFAPLHLLFASGMFVAWALQQKKVPYPWLIFTTGTLFFFAVIVYAGHVGYVSQRLYLVSGIGATFSLLGAANLERSRRLTVPPWLIFLGDASYSVYLIHYPVVSHLAPLAFRLDTRLHLPIVLWMLLLFAAATAAGCLLHVLIERPLLNWLRRPGKRSVPAVIQAF